MKCFYYKQLLITPC